MSRRKFLALLGGATVPAWVAGASAKELDYSKLHQLDAEDLAEQGMKTAYEALAADLRHHGIEPAAMAEEIDPDAPTYAVHISGRKYVVYSPEVTSNDYQSWGQATYLFFKIVNDQLAEINSKVRFYAINGGNDLGGLFLMPDDAIAARNSLPRREDWPYIPTDTAPWYGQFH
ncbi:hypothetical protein [Labrys neptuniae]|uniref:Tat pathway signal protein n=1 Tax=Labrys neptuniae TaxID=376174 RepID=A0ABV3PT56_9HYPH